MFVVNDDLSIYATRGDIVFFGVQAEENGAVYKFQPGDVIRMKIYGRKAADSVYLEKTFAVEEESDTFVILLTSDEMKIGDIISKPVDYWYEIELNPFTNPQTIIGYDDDGPKIFKVFPEGGDVEHYEPDEEDIPFVDDELDPTSTRPIQNQAVTRAIMALANRPGGNADLTGYATEQWVEKGYQPKGDYLKNTELAAAVNVALAQAKESGEFDGEDGVGIADIAISGGTASTGSPDETVITIRTTDSKSKSFVVRDGTNGTNGVDGTAMYTFNPDEALTDGVLNGTLVNIPDGHKLKVGDLLLAPSGDVYVVGKETYSTGMFKYWTAEFAFTLIVSGGNTDLTGCATEEWVQENYQPKGEYLTEIPSGYATEEFVKNKIAEAELGGEEVDLSGYAQKSELPTKVSQLENDAGYLTEHQDLSEYAKKTEIPAVPVQSVNGKTGAVSLTASDVGADPAGTAASSVSEHNTGTDSHNDIRLELKAISDRLTAFFDSDDQTLDELSEIVAYITSNKTLIESITTSKVNVADIINNLTTNVANKPLSAAQGVVLKGLIDTLNNSLSGYQPKGEYALRSEIPTVPTKVSAFQNDKGYLTEHCVVQDIEPEDTSVLWIDPTDDSDDGFQEAVNYALAQAKASGEFDGADGKDGKTPVKGTDYFTDADKTEMVKAVISALPVYAGEVV